MLREGYLSSKLSKLESITELNSENYQGKINAIILLISGNLFMKNAEKQTLFLHPNNY